MTIAWSAGMASGSTVLDAEHRRLVERVDGLVSALEEGQGRPDLEHALRSLGDVAVREFGRDEDCPFRDRCPAVAANGQAHAELIGILARIRRDVEAGPRGQGEDESAGEARRALVGWLGRYLPGASAATLPCVEAAH